MIDGMSRNPGYRDHEEATDMQEETSPDPIVDPQGYQNHLLGLLGEDDPAEVQAATPSAFRKLIAELGRT